ncbi:MAG: tetratricopeptide repeat protein [Pirellulales bacterium]|nr:tetratricopeptide repeat protein [Pirellulales bacterium]
MTRIAASRWLPGALVIGATLLVFAWSISFPLLDWDDHLNISENRLINPPSLGGLLVLWTRPYAGLYVPATYTWWSGEAALAGLPATVDQPHPLDARVFHAGNVLLHAANAWLVWLLLVRLTGTRWAPAAGALLFALHPLQVESACWVTETKGLLCGLFSFSALLVFDRLVARCGERRSPPGDLPAKLSLVLLYLAAAALFALALLAKPAAATLPLAAWLVATWPGRTQRVAASVPLLDGGDRADLGTTASADKQCADSALLAGGQTDQVKACAVTPASSGTRVDPVSNLSRVAFAMFLLPWLAIALGFAILTREAQAAESLVEPTAWWQRPIVAADALAFYLFKLTVPLDLAPDYGRSPAWLLASNWAWVTWLLPVGLAGVVAWPRLRWWRLAGLLSIVLLLPVLGLVPFAFQRFSTVADRYAYLAMVGPAIALTVLAAKARRRAALVTIVVILVVSALVSAAQTRHWRSDRALFAHAVAVNPRSSVALNGLGNIHSRDEEWSAALASYRRAVEADPHNASSYLNVGRAEMALGRPLPAIKSFERALELRPGYAKVHEPYAQALVAVGRVDDGAVQLQLLLEAQPQNATAWENLGRVRAFQGRKDEAIRYLKRALEINPRQDSAQRELARLSGQERTPP